MLRPKHEEIEIPVPGKACQGATSVRSLLRTRHLRRLEAVRCYGGMKGRGSLLISSF